MNELDNRISILLEATENWIHKDNHYLSDAIDCTVQEGYFSYHDIRYALEGIRESITLKSLEEWTRKAGLNNDSIGAGSQNVLCLHAGNIPLVGFQDVFSTLLSGARYSGKISRKDPYLLPTFLNEVKKTKLWTDRDVQWTHRLYDFEDMQNDAVIFAGSESSVPEVRKAIEKLNLATENTRYLIRTAHFSLAYVDSNERVTMENLVNSILRYGGKGCRSVAVVVSPYSLDEMKDTFILHAKSFWHENPQYEGARSKLKQQFAYNKAIERNQLYLKHFLVQEGGLELNHDFICYWVEGEEQKTAELADRFESELQSIYLSNPDKEIPGHQHGTENLSQAQKPPISWEPDGTDTLEWLCRGCG